MTLSRHTALAPTITEWAIPDEGWLKVTVRTDPLWMTECFYRVKDPAVQGSSTRIGKPETWAWFRWPMAGKPSVAVRSEGSAVLDALVLDHPVLSRISDQFGLTS